MAIEIATNNSQETYCPTYSVQITWPESTDTSDTIAPMSVDKSNAMSDDVHLQSSLQQLKIQYAPAKVFALHSSDTLTTLLQLETAVSQHIQTFYDQLSQIPKTELSSEAVAAIVIRIQGPVHIPLDFTIIQLPLRDTESQPHTSVGTAVVSALLYATSRRPTAVDFEQMLSHSRGIYQLQSPLPIVAAYYHESATTESADVPYIQHAIYNALEQVTHTETFTNYDSAKLSASISNSVLVDRTAIATNNGNRKACDTMFEEVRCACINDKLLQWRVLFERFCARANGVKDVKDHLKSGVLASKGITQVLSDVCDTLKSTAISYLKIMFECIQQQLTAAASYTGERSVIDWIDMTCKVFVQGFSDYAITCLNEELTDQLLGSISSDALTTVLHYVSDYINSEVSL
jgi:hypothetical protein